MTWLSLSISVSEAAGQLDGQNKGGSLEQYPFRSKNWTAKINLKPLWACERSIQHEAPGRIGCGLREDAVHRPQQYLAWLGWEDLAGQLTSVELDLESMVT